MRQHILICPGISSDEKERVKSAIEARENAQALKKASNKGKGSDEEEMDMDATVHLKEAPVPVSTSTGLQPQREQPQMQQMNNPTATFTNNATAGKRRKSEFA